MQATHKAYQEEIERKFDGFIRSVLRNKVADFYRHDRQRRKAENDLKLLAKAMLEEELLNAEKNAGFGTKDIFLIDNVEILIKEEALANALRSLSQYRLEIILLYFFLEKTEKEIGELLHRTQQTINYQRQNTLMQLKRYLELEEF